jgi:hypothetical protein
MKIVGVLIKKWGKNVKILKKIKPVEIHQLL